MFQGFSKETVDFMWGIRFNNDKPWFEAHKEEYLTHFYQPMKALGQDLYEGFALKHEELGLMCRVSRIYRDARRLHGQGPYKDHLWLTLEQPSEDWSCQPVFWFEMGPEEYSFGLGYWMAKAATMAKLRHRMDTDPKPMEKFARQIQKQDAFTLNGEDFKRRKEAPSALLDPWYNKKGGFSLRCERPHDELAFSDKLPEYIIGEWEKLLPLFRYISTLDGDPDPREAK